MLDLKGYQLISAIYEGSKTIIYQATKKPEGNLAIVKTLKSEYPTLEEITRLRNEYNILRSVNIPGVIKPIELAVYNNSLALILQDFGGTSLKEQIDGRKKLEIGQFLQIAINLVHTLAQLHQNQIVHKDIKPHNILINPATWEIQIIDFSIATRLDRETPQPTNPSLLEGTLAYMSPEQTGRMNRTIDYRTDFYSLGVTFYELLTGRLPFETTDPMELVHCHIAKKPTSPSQIEPEIPQTLSAIVMKLLAKTAEERYQSASGIKADLEECLLQLQTSGKIEKFVPGKLDSFSQFIIPQKLYGREAEVALLMDTFERVASGSSEMMLVSGYSGIGKTAVVNEVHKPIVAARGYFIAGKFDQFKRNIPYAALIQAFSELLDQLLTETSEQLAVWKEKLTAALGQNARVIIDVIPEVELLIGSQPDVPELGPTESQNRFNRVFKQFLNVFTSKEHPLVLFLDDLQWADNASLKLIKQLLADLESQYLLFIGAYRDNEVSPTHPTIITVEEIEKAGAAVNNIVLGALDRKNVGELVADTLNERERAPELADLLFNKTQGNPFFLTQLFKTLYQEKQLFFDFTKRGWFWDIEQIQSREIADYNVVELVVRNISKLSEATQQVLKLAACIGNRFNLDVLAIVNQQSVLVTADDLWEALQAGLILPLSNAYKIPLGIDRKEEVVLKHENFRVSYKFLHDRVQQAAYSLIPESEKKATHLKIGRLLLEKTHQHILGENIFDIVNQLNIGLELITEESEKQELAKMNLMAGRKAKAATAYEAAVGYLNVGLELLPERAWESDYELTRDIYLETLEAEYLNTNFDRAQKLSEIVLLQVKNQLEKVKVYELRIPFYLQQNQPQVALDTALQVLKMLGVSLPKNPKKSSIVVGLIRNKLILGSKRIEDLALLPLMTDPYKLAAIRILIAVIPAAFMTNPMLFPLIVFKMVNLSLQYGNSPLSAFGYVTYGMLLCGALSDIESGYQFGKLAVNLVELFDAKELKAKIEFHFNSFIRQWKEHVKKIIEPLFNSFLIGLETGDIEYACYSACFYSKSLFWKGENLEDVGKTFVKYIDMMGLYQQFLISDQAKLSEQFILNICGKSVDKFILSGEIFDENQMLPILKSHKNYTFISFVYLSKSMLFYLFKNYALAVEISELTEKYKESMGSVMHSSEHNFYYSLALLAHYSSVTKPEQKQYLKKLAINQKQMKIWAHHAPMNFQHKYDLVEAEKARVLGHHLQAMELYDRAIAGAKEQGFIQEEAIANERAAEFYLALGREQVAKAYMTQAYYGYIRWGAVAKVKDLDEQYPHLISRTETVESSTLDITRTTTSSTTGKNAQILDLTTVLKSSVALSGEIVLSNLLDKLMKIVLENAGAEKGFFITKSDNEWIVTASGCVDSGEVTVVQSQILEIQDNLPRNVLNYVERTKEPLVLDDATTSKNFASDAYIQRHPIKSILCLPLIHQNKLTGILYLENNQTARAFTRRHLQVLNLLTSQISIAIENAQLYGNLQQANQQLEDYSHNLEQKVEERTAQLKAAQKQIVAQEKLASLGALTAGVAHEIRNPLNFVNSLATLSEGLTAELADEIDRQSAALDPESVEYIAEVLGYLKRNVSEIHQQGERANTIVQSMLMHAHPENSQRQLADFNTLVAQAAKLAYHSRRDKDDNLEIAIATDYDDSIGELELFSIDLSRAIINIVDNSCYAVAAKQKKIGSSFTPAISITTKNFDSTVEIRIHDNGLGIASEIQDKIFNPFFTTKPPGQGTGLGLSLTHDIIAGQHGGQIEVNSKLGEYTEVVVTLPKAIAKA